MGKLKKRKQPPVKEYKIYDLLWHRHAKRYVNFRWFFLLSVIVPGVLGSIVGLGFSNTVIRDTIIISIIALGSNILAGILAYRHNSKTSYIRLLKFLLIFDLILITILVYARGGIESRSFLLYVIPMLLSSTFFGRRGLIYITGLSITLYSSLILFLYFGVISPVNTYSSGLQNNTGYVTVTLAFIPAVFMIIAALADYSVRLIAKREKDALALAEELSNEKYNLELEKSKDEAILRSIQDGVLAINTDHQIILFNKALEKIAGYNSSDVLAVDYRTVLAFKNNNTHHQDNSFVEKALTGKSISKAQQKSMILIGKDGKETPVEVTASPIYESQSTIIGAIITIRDITEEISLDMAKKDFVSMASHQLLTPLSSISWYSETMLSGDAGKLSSLQTEHLREIYASTQRMAELVDSFLTASRLEMKKSKLTIKEVDLEELISAEQNALKPVIAMKDIKFKVDIPSKMPKILNDPKMVSMILQNLISNAVKYTADGGKVIVAVRSESNKVGRRYLIVEIEDNGYGIPQEQHKNIFTKMFRADNVQDMEGTGLGLYIAKEAATRIGAKLTFKSELSKGTTFTLRLPIV